MKKTRKDCVYGIHFDSHVLPGESIVKDRHPNFIPRILDTVRPDFVQIDTKGHHGISSYATKIGTPPKYMEVDFSRIWREETKKRGILLYAHHSSIWEDTVVKDHPDWAVVSEDGQISKQKVSVFSPYVKEILIPQLIELACDYGFDGAWIDGDNWSAEIDYSNYAKEAYFKATGKNAPKSTDEDYKEYIEFNRKAIEEFDTYYISEVKKAAPDFEIAINGLYIVDRFEAMKVPISLCTMDVAVWNSFQRSRYFARLAASRELPWDLMSWQGNTGPGGFFVHAADAAPKSDIELCHEAAISLSLGGAFEYCCEPMRDPETFTASITPAGDWVLEDWAKVRDFCYERKPFCMDAKPVNQVGVLLSYAAAEYCRTSVYHETTKANEAAKGMVLATLDNQYSAEILFSHQLLEKDISSYGVIIVPEADVLEEEIIEKLKVYAQNGGSLMLASPKTAMLFKDIIGTEIIPKEKKLYKIQGYRHIDGIYSDYSELIPNTAYVSGKRYNDANCETDKVFPLAVINNYGKGKVCTIGFDFGSLYLTNKMISTREFMDIQLKELFKNPIVTVKGSHLLDVSVMKKNGILCINLVNRVCENNISNHYVCAEVRNIDEIPPLIDLEIGFLTENSDTEIFCEPEHKKLETYYKDGRLWAKLPRLHIHSILTAKI